MSSAEELLRMRDFIPDKEITEAESYPLVTYFGPVDKDGLAAMAQTGQHLRVAAIAARFGIPKAAWPLHLLNLHDAIKDLDQKALIEGQWKEKWNGVWLHQSHGNPGSAQVNGIKNGAKFYDAYARHIIENKGFKYGIIKTCFGARPPGGSPSSFIENIVKAAQNKKAVLFASQGNTWIPLSGPYRGCPLISLTPFIQLCGGSDKETFSKYYTGPVDKLPKWLEDPEEFDKITPHITDAYCQEALFRPDRALSITKRPVNSIGDISWYGTF